MKIEVGLVVSQNYGKCINSYVPFWSLPDEGEKLNIGVISLSMYFCLMQLNRENHLMDFYGHYALESGCLGLTKWNLLRLSSSLAVNIIELLIIYTEISVFVRLFMGWTNGMGYIFIYKVMHIELFQTICRRCNEIFHISVAAGCCDSYILHSRCSTWSTRSCMRSSGLFCMMLVYTLKIWFSSYVFAFYIATKFDKPHVPPHFSSILCGIIQCNMNAR